MQGRRSLGPPLFPNLFATPPQFRVRGGFFNPFGFPPENQIQQPEDNIMDGGVNANNAPQGGNGQIPEVREEMRQFARPTMALPGNSIVQGQAARNYELKGTYLNMLPSFHGLPAEDALAFIRDFYQVIEQMPLHQLNEDQLRLRCFPHCLKDRAKNWLTALPEGSIHSWEQCFEAFINKFYSYAKTTHSSIKHFNFDRTNSSNI